MDLKNGRGILFKNAHKTEDKHPDWSGEIVVPNGERYDLMLYVTTSKKGENYIKVKVSPTDESG